MTEKADETFVDYTSIPSSFATSICRTYGFKYAEVLQTIENQSRKNSELRKIIIYSMRTEYEIPTHKIAKLLKIDNSLVRRYVKELADRRDDDKALTDLLDRAEPNGMIDRLRIGLFYTKEDVPLLLPSEQSEFGWGIRHPDNSSSIVECLKLFCEQYDLVYERIVRGYKSNGYQAIKLTKAEKEKWCTQ